MHASLRTLAGLATMAALALVLAPAATAAPATYTDPAGDAKSAPDVTNVSVDLDAASHGLRFDIDLANGEQLANGGLVLIMLNADRNGGTGDRVGSDYVVGLAAAGAVLLKWNGSEMAPYNHAPMSVARAPGKLTVGFCSCDISSENFDFAVAGLRGDDVDIAPDTGATFPIPAVAIEIESFVYAPKPLLPKAGKRFTLKPIGIRLGGTNEVVLPDSVACSAKLSGKALKGSGAGGCSWLLPKKSRGKKLVVSATVTYQGQTETFSQTFKVT